MPTSAEQQSFETFFERVADPEQFIGGGSVAALTAAGAAATALLVVRLNRRRKANTELADAIAAASDELTALVVGFYAAAERDVALLDRLLMAQREMKTSGDPARYYDALAAAARSPIEMAESIARLLALIDEQVPVANRFTVSDLGAAAVLADGACRAALLTAEVNVALLQEAEAAGLGPA